MPSIPPRSHSNLDRELMLLRDNVLRLSTMVDMAIMQTQKVTRNFEVELARQIVADDKKINRLRYKIEEDAYRLISRHQTRPAARDLRGIISSIHIAAELERIGDYAAGNCRLLLEMSHGALLKPQVGIPKMLDLSRQMMRGAINAYIHWDEEQARRTILRDQEIDAINKRTYDELIAIMQTESDKVRHATYILWMSHNCERIGDRITNICERVIYMVVGEIYYGIRQKPADPDDL